jgi:uncharacterized membrane protein
MLEVVINYFTANHCAELIGTISNIILIITYCMHGEKKIRTLSILGSLVSIFYNYYMHSTCFLILSVILIFVNLYYLLLVKSN